MIGRTLAHYEIIEQLGSGGMGDVYRARDTKLGRNVAIKVLPAEFSSDPERRKRFMREAKAIAALNHPNIVHIYSVEEIDEVSFISMELVEGGTLGKEIPIGGLPLDRFFDYAIPLADAISSAHDSGITHRDLKPANVMIDREGRIKVLDFGLAKLLESGLRPENARTVVDGSDTAAGLVLGTAAYMSPEQAEGRPIDHRSDIFSLGIILYQMAAGERPFKGDTQLSTLSSILKDTPRHISEIRREIPRHVGRIVSHCLEKKPDSRFQSAKDVRNELIGVQREIDSGELTAESERVVSMAAPARARRWLPLAAVSVVVVAAIGYFVLRNGKGGDQAAGTGILEPQAKTGLKMAVVLPFENLGLPEDAYFAAGMTEELTSRLSAVKGLGVISRTSARQYDRTGKTVRQIGEDLGADYVIEGSVRFATTPDGGGRVRITPTLIRVVDDTQVWAKMFDRTIDDVFEVQTEIAQQVVTELGVTLGATEKDLVASKPTQNMKAYEAYIRAKDYTSPEGDFAAQDAYKVRLYEKAVELDPNFLDAWAQLSMHHSLTYHGPLDKTESRIEAARAALQKADGLNPNHPLTRLARGAYYYYCFRDYDRALEEYLAATQIVPNSAEAWAAVAWIYRRQGKWPEHFETILKAMELDPQNWDFTLEIGNSYRAVREIEKSIQYFDMALELNEDQAGIVFSKAEALRASRGGYHEVMRFLESVKPSIPRFWSESFVHLQYGEFDKARAALDQIPNVSPEFDAWRAQEYALVEYYENGRSTAMSKLIAAEKLVRAILDRAPSNDEMRATLATNLAAQGRAEEAIREARLAVDLTAKDKFSGPVNLEALAGVYAQVGRHSEAVDLLERLLKTNYFSSVTETLLREDPLWAPLRSEPSFKALMRPSS